MTRFVSIGLIQMSCEEDVQANYRKAIDNIRQAAGQGANIVCLQELFKSRYFCQAVDNKLFELAEPVDRSSPTVQQIGELAAELDVVLIASLFVGVLLVGDRLQEALNFRRRAPWLSVGLGLLLIMLPELLSDFFRVVFPIGTGLAFSLFSKALVLVTVAAGLGALVLSRLGGSESGESPQPSL